MKFHSIARNLARWATVPMLLALVVVGIAQPPGRGPDRNDRGRDSDDRGRDFHFRDQDRGRFESHYHKDIDHWRKRPQGRPRFVRGQQIPNGYRFKSVPRAYYADVPPPPPGYQYGYYDGYVVAYNPTTRIIADVLDLVAAAAR
jgi:Ni/Co efflux regulator RcnB